MIHKLFLLLAVFCLVFSQTNPWDGSWKVRNGSANCNNCNPDSVVISSGNSSILSSNDIIFNVTTKFPNNLFCLTFAGQTYNITQVVNKSELANNSIEIPSYSINATYDPSTDTMTITTLGCQWTLNRT